MIGEGLSEDTLRHLVLQHAVRECVVVKVDGRLWGLSIRLGADNARRVPLRSRRETIRTWTSLTAVGKFADWIGLKSFVVEL